MRYSQVAKSIACELTNTTLGTLDGTTIKDVPADTTAKALKEALTVSEKATAKVVDKDGNSVADDTKVVADMKTVVTAEDGKTTKTYTLTIKVAAPVDPAIGAKTEVAKITNALAFEVVDADKADAQKVTAAAVAAAQKLVNVGYTVDKKADGTIVEAGKLKVTFVVTGTRIENKAETNELTLIFKTKAAAPVISKDLGALATNKGAALSVQVEATSPDRGTLSYQWYKADDTNKTNATEISGATNAKYSVPVDKSGTSYYYCVITNTNDTVTGTKTAKTTSKIAKVEVLDRLAQVKKPVLSNSGVATWTNVANATIYEVDLYKDGTRVSTKQCSSGTTGVDLSSEITKSGAGSYTVKVIAISQSGSFLNSDESEASDSVVK